MRNIFHLILALALLLLMAPTSWASASTHIVISEVQVAGANSASEEFVEVYNPTSFDVTLTAWTIEYKSATSADIPSSWTKKASLSGTIKAHGYYLAAPKSYIAASDTEWMSTLAATAGNVRLKDKDGLVIDQLGYGATANAPETKASIAPSTGQSLERLPGRLSELSGNGTDTDDNSADFIVRLDPQPQASSAPPETATAGPEETSDTGIPSNEAENDSVAVSNEYSVITITELLVDPVSPLTDNDDEFIELYNPGIESVNLKGYELRCGSNFHDFYVLPDITLLPGAYLALYAKDTKLGLTNSGGTVQLQSPDGRVLDASAAYPVALPGQAWALIGDSWQWTAQLTPGQPNALSEMPATLAPAKKGTVKKSSTSVKKTTKAPKPKSVKKVKVKKPKVKKVAAIPLKPLASRNLQPSRWLLITLAIFTMGYALYEFRYDIQNLYFKFTGNERSRRTSRSGAQGRRDD